MTAYLLAVEITGVVEDPDLLDAIVRSVLTEGLAQYREYGDLDPFARLTVHLGATVALDDATLARRTAALRARHFAKLLEYRAAAPPDEPTRQLAMPGL